MFLWCSECRVGDNQWYDLLETTKRFVAFCQWPSFSYLLCNIGVAPLSVTVHCNQPVGNGQIIQKNTKQYPSMRTNHFFQQILILQVSHSASGTLLHKEEAAASQSHNDGWWLKGKKNLRNNWVFSAFLQDENNSYLANLAEASFIAAKFYLNSSIFTMFGALPPVHHVFVGRGTQGTQLQLPVEVGSCFVQTFGTNAPMNLVHF